MSWPSEIKNVLKEAGSTTFILLKILIPVSIIVKILAEFGLIKVIGEYLSPVMNFVGLPGEFGLVWATAMSTNIYAGIVVFINLSLTNIYSVAQVTILACMMLLAHALPIEVRIAQKAGVRLWYTLFLRIGGAILLGFLLNIIFTMLNLFQYNNKSIWQPIDVDPSLTVWIVDQLKFYLMIFLIILTLVSLMTILKKSGAINHLNKFLEPVLRISGMSKNAAPLTIIGTTLGLAYGGGLIIKEAKSGLLSKKDVFYSLSLMGMSHSLIEDTLLTLTIGASIFFILFGRVIFALIIMIILIKIVSHISTKTFEKYLVN